MPFALSLSKGQNTSYNYTMSQYLLVIAVALQLCGILGCSEPKPNDGPLSKAASEFIPGCNLLTAVELQEIAMAVSSVVDKDPSVLAVREFVSIYGPKLEKYPPPKVFGVFRFVESEWVSDGVTDAVSVTLILDDWEMFGKRSFESREINIISLSKANKEVFSMLSDKSLDYSGTENDRYIFEAGLWRNMYDGGGYGQCGYSNDTSAVMPYGSVSGSHCGVEQNVKVLLEPPGLRLTAEINDRNAIVNYHGYSRSTTDAQTNTCNFDFPSGLFVLEFFIKYVYVLQ